MQKSLWCKYKIEFIDISSNESQFISVCDSFVSKYVEVDTDVWLETFLCNGTRLYWCLSLIKLEFFYRKWTLKCFADNRVNLFKFYLILFSALIYFSKNVSLHSRTHFIIFYSQWLINKIKKITVFITDT